MHAPRRKHHVPSIACRLLALPAALLLTSAATARAAEEIEVLEDEWYVLYLMGAPVGRARVRVMKKGDRVRSDEKAVVSIRRGAVTIKTSEHVKAFETADGTPLRFEMTRDAAMENLKIKGRIEDGRLLLTSETMGKERQQTLDWPEETVVGYAMERHIRKELERLDWKAGSRFGFKAFSTEIARFVDVTCEVLGDEEIDVFGERVGTTKVRMEGLVPNIVPVDYRDRSGVLWKQVVRAGGLDMVMLRSTKDASGREVSARAELDIIGSLAVNVSGRIKRQFEVDLARYRLRLREGSIRELPLEGPGQTVERFEGEGVAVLRVESVRGESDKAPPFPVTDATLRSLPAEAGRPPATAGKLRSTSPELAKYLEPTTYLQSDDPALAAKAREVAGNAKNSCDAAKLLERWVHDHVRQKDFSRGFATAKEVFRDRAGDCTEHAVLLAAMLRAVGIPSRAASGLTYMEPLLGPPRMLYHMWTDAWLGEWVPLDATLARPFVDACHIRLGSSDLSEFTPEAGMLEMVRCLGLLDVDVLDYRLDGRVVRP